MKAVISKLKKELKWRGRRYLAGLIHGFGVGICISLLMALQLGWKPVSVYFSNIMIMGVLFVSMLGHLILPKDTGENSKSK